LPSCGEVVNPEIARRATVLAAPAIALENGVGELAVRLGFKP
jgi:hypothetical protein